MEQCANKFCYNSGKTATEMSEMLVQVYGREAVSRKCVYAFVKGRKQLRMSHVWVSHRQAEPQKWLRKCDKCWHKKAAIKGERFADMNVIKDRVTVILWSIPQEALADCFWKLYKYQTCVVADGDIFEGQWRKFVFIFCFVCFLIGFIELFRHTMHIHIYLYIVVRCHFWSSLSRIAWC